MEYASPADRGGYGDDAATSTFTGAGNRIERQWHGRFERVFLPMGMFKMNRIGNLEHIETGSEDFRAFAIEEPR